MNTPAQVSNCCNAELVILNGREGINHYICGACNHSCDAKSLTPVKGQSLQKHSTGTPTMSNSFRKLCRGERKA